MQLPDVKALKELLKLLRAQGVLQYSTPDLSLVLTEAPVTTTRKQTDIEETIDDSLSEEEEAERLLYYSAISPLDSVPEK